MDAIVNVSPNWGIGFDNKLLAVIGEDLRRFRRLTLGKTVVLGRKTLETFPDGKPLNKRRNLVLSRNAEFCVEGAEVFHSLPQLRAELRTIPREEVCVIGGASVYRALLPFCDRALVTRNDCRALADAFFPNLDDLPDWVLTDESELFSAVGMNYRFVEYINKNPKKL